MKSTADWRLDMPRSPLAECLQYLYRCCFFHRQKGERQWWMASIAWKQPPTEEMLWHCLYMNIIQSVIRFKVVAVLVGSASQCQNKRVPDGWGCPSSSILPPSSSCPSPGSPCCTLSYLISPSSFPAPPPPRPPEARGRRGGTGACDWPLHCTACREPAGRRREGRLQAGNSTPRDNVRVGMQMSNFGDGNRRKSDTWK